MVHVLIMAGASFPRAARGRRSFATRPQATPAVERAHRDARRNSIEPEGMANGVSDTSQRLAVGLDGARP
jgi:hypothetical protein